MKKDVEALSGLPQPVGTLSLHHPRSHDPAGKSHFETSLLLVIKGGRQILPGVERLFGHRHEQIAHPLCGEPEDLRLEQALVAECCREIFVILGHIHGALDLVGLTKSRLSDLLPLTFH